MITLQTEARGKEYTLKAAVLEVTPELAGQWLAEATAAGAINRKETNIDRYALDMKSGKWFLSGQPIIFNDEDILVDGFNRCKACAVSNSSFPALVIKGIDSKSFDVIDTGKTRSLVDLLAMKFSNEDDKMKYVAVAGYIAKRIVCLENDRPVLSSTATTRVEEMQAVKKHREDIEAAASLARTKFGDSQPSLMAFLYWYYVIYLRKARAKQFFSDYANVSSHYDLNNDEESSYVKNSARIAETLYKFFNGGTKSKPVRLTKRDAVINAVSCVEHFLAQKPATSTIAQIRSRIQDVNFTKTGVVFTKFGA